MTLHITRWL